MASWIKQTHVWTIYNMLRSYIVQCMLYYVDLFMSNDSNDNGWDRSVAHLLLIGSTRKLITLLLISTLVTLSLFLCGRELDFESFGLGLVTSTSSSLATPKETALSTSSLSFSYESFKLQ